MIRRTGVRSRGRRFRFAHPPTISGGGVLQWRLLPLTRRQRLRGFFTGRRSWTFEAFDDGTRNIAGDPPPWVAGPESRADFLDRVADWYRQAEIEDPS